MNPMRDAVLRGIGFIEQNLHRDIGVCDVANAVSYSQFYFSREFSRAAHISVYDYILRRKISESYKDLFGGQEKIVDLAFRYGFGSHEVYTRAFKKMFGQNPSEVSVFRPLAVYEAVDGHYLDFLDELRVEVFDNPVGDCWFEVNGVSDLSEPDSSFLVGLSKDNSYECSCIFRGEPQVQKKASLAFKLAGMNRKTRIYSDNARFSFRYFLDSFYEPDEMAGNYILLHKENGSIDILVPQVDQ